MAQPLWIPDDRKIIVCIDSYDNGRMQGRFCTPRHMPERFDSLCQLLLKMDAALEQTQSPQSYTAARRFSHPPLPERPVQAPVPLDKGVLATFQLQVRFRQHSSWQGTLLWLEPHREQRFRSVLELMTLMDSALRESMGCEAG